MTPDHAIVYILDDDEIILWTLKELLKDIGADIRTYASAVDFLDAYAPSALPECLLCDLRMPTINGIGVQSRLLEKGVDLPIIFVSGHGEVKVAVDLLKKGAFDFLEKPVSGNELVHKVQQALAHSRQLKKEHLERSVIDARLAILTPKERQIIKLVVNGNSSQKIAAELGLSPRTVENHRARIMDKLHIRSTVELVKLFL